MRGNKGYLDGAILSVIVDFYLDKVHPDDIAFVLQTSIGEGDREPAVHGKNYYIQDMDGTCYMFTAYSSNPPKLHFDKLSLIDGLYTYAERNQLWYTLTALSILAKEVGAPTYVCVQPLISFLAEISDASNYFLTNDMRAKMLHTYLISKGEGAVLLRSRTGITYVPKWYDPFNIASEKGGTTQVVQEESEYPKLPFLGDLEYILYYYNWEVYGASGIPYMLVEFLINQALDK